MMINWTQIGNSFDGLKTWVKLWILFLLIVNGASLFFLSTPVGRWTALAACFIAVFNFVLILWYSGLTRALAFPHLIWVPLIIAITLRLSGSDHQTEVGIAEFVFGIVIVVTNGVSLLFDINDSIQWIRGKREVLGL